MTSRRESNSLGEEALGRIPGLVQVWYRAESDSVVDLRLELGEDSWDAREQVIDAMVAWRAEKIADVSINFSFVLPDVAYDDAPAPKGQSERVHAFV